ncbi:hypothetical protein [Pedobacter alluvionis]|nr:hypothetical protein [Pedobacter alluvionis]TFB30816.1 hypothetical protein E3V97_09260 [Pedobacter alluvionis]
MEEILNQLGIDKRIIDLSFGVIRPFDEFSSWEYYGAIDGNDKSGFPYPPLFIPIIIDYNSTPIADGIIKHWFTDRVMSFGFMDFGNSFQLGESSINQNQYIEALFFEQFTNQHRSIINNEVLDKAKELGLSENQLTVFKNLTDKKQHNTECYLPSFISDPPLNCIQTENSYKGAHPSNNEILIERNLNNASFFEIFQKEWIGYESPKDSFSWFKKKPNFKPAEYIPEWLKPETNKHQLFDKYVSNNEYDKAWLTINGPGFTPKEVGERLQQLKAYSSDATYHLWADFWCKKYGDMDTFIFI